MNLARIFGIISPSTTFSVAAKLIWPIITSHQRYFIVAFIFSCHRNRSLMSEPSPLKGHLYSKRLSKDAFMKPFAELRSNYGELFRRGQVEEAVLCIDKRIKREKRKNVEREFSLNCHCRWCINFKMFGWRVIIKLIC